MSRFQMYIHKPDEVQIELCATLTLSQWCEVKSALGGVNLHGPARWLRDSIDEMTRKAYEDYRAWPEEIGGGNE